MKNLLRVTCLGAGCVMLSALSSGPVMATPIGVLFTQAGEVGAANPYVEVAHYRKRMGRRGTSNRRGYRGNRHRSYRSHGYRSRSYGSRGNSAINLGALILGGLILSETARLAHHRNNASAWARCENRYRSFETRTGKYTGYDGIRRTCPYLR